LSARVILGASTTSLSGIHLAGPEAQLFDIVLKIIANLGVIVGGTAVYIALRSNSRQLGAQIFLTYSNRIHQLRQTLAIDVDVYRPFSDVTDLDPEARRVVVEALYAIFEFYSLRRQGYVATAIWSIWEPDMARLLSTAAFRHEWSLLRKRFETHPHFIAWVAKWHGQPPFSQHY
jgi:hypothetical protein